MGVSGTLKNMSKVQREVLVNDFYIHEETYIPAVFGDYKLTFDKTSNVSVVPTTKPQTKSSMLNDRK